jgi:hypothetical protein
VLNVADGSLVGVHSDQRQSYWDCAEVDGRLLVGTFNGSLLVFDGEIWGEQV